MEEILTKVPPWTLLRCGAVSKLWYHSIHIDKHLTYAHFLQSQKQPNLIFNLLNVRVGADDTGKGKLQSQLFRIDTGIFNHANVLKFQKLPAGLVHGSKCELVGYCNGFPCVLFLDKKRPSYQILQPTNGDRLHIYCPNTICGERISLDQIICNGFGFDSLASEYKLVSILRTFPKQLNFVVYTLGTKFWREVTTSMPVSYHGHPIIRLKAATSSDKSAIFCNSSSGCLVWKIVATMAREGGDEHNNVNDNNNEMEIEMLLLFNLHDEKFQFIRLPTKSPADEQQKQLLVDYPHLLEFKGYPCIASLEKGFGNGSDDYCHRRCRDHHDSTSCCKVHMYILKDNVKQVWVKQESLDVRMTSHGMSYIGIRTLDPAVFALAALLSLVLVSSVSLIRFYSTGLLGKNFKFTTCIPKNLIL